MICTYLFKLHHHSRKKLAQRRPKPGCYWSLLTFVFSRKFWSSAWSSQLFRTISTPQYIEKIQPIKIYAKKSWNTPTMKRVLLHLSVKPLMIIVPVPNIQLIKLFILTRDDNVEYKANVLPRSLYSWHISN